MDDNFNELIQNAKNFVKNNQHVIDKSYEFAQNARVTNLNLQANMVAAQLSLPNIYYNKNFIEQTIRSIEIQRQINLSSELFRNALKAVANINKLQLQNSFNRLVQITNDAFAVDEINLINKKHPESTIEVFENKDVEETVKNSKIFEDKTTDNFENKLEELKILLNKKDINFKQKISKISSYEINQIIFAAFSINSDLNNGKPTINNLLFSLDYIVDELTAIYTFSLPHLKTIIIGIIINIITTFYVVPFLQGINFKNNEEDLDK